LIKQAEIIPKTILKMKAIVLTLVTLAVVAHWNSPKRELESIFIDENKAINLIFIHSSFSFAQSLFPIASDYRIKRVANSYLISMPNHGNSYDDPDFSLDSITKDVRDFILKKGLKNVYVVGHSLGGLVAMNLAAKYGNLVSGIVSLDFLPFPTAEPILNILKTVVGGFLTVDLKRPMTDIRQSLLAIYPDSEVIDLFVGALEGKDGDYNWTTNVQYYYDNIDNLFKAGVPIRRFRGKFKLVTGTQSQFYVPSLFPQLVKYYPKINLSKDIVEVNSGHVVYARFQEETTQAILDILN
jgi:pimeloyl-ACP methyl ester carboxylesterase